MTWQEALQDYFDKLKPEQQQWLQKWVLLDAPLLAEIEDTETLIALFKRNGRLVHTALLRLKYGKNGCYLYQPMRYLRFYCKTPPSNY